ncbi:integrase [Desulfofustis limnaeus]|uniref:Integrase n=2 Tax=Desulfofustis limnaeus TaxID=2740163 RepID=A0ABM7W432_9BACT|nr:integrase [Desulfofustis limnaeus]
MVTLKDSEECLSTTQLNLLEQSFRTWSEESKPVNVRLSRAVVLLVFLLIRYTGAKLHEVLAVNPSTDIDWDQHRIRFRRNATSSSKEARGVQVSQLLAEEIKTRVEALASQTSAEAIFNLDPGFVRRKFYERAESCGITKHLGGPEAIRKARAVELMQGNIPLPAVQMILGHSTPNLTSSYVSFSKEEAQAVIKRFMEQESGRKTSARNRFIGKVSNIIRGDIQSQVELSTVDNHSITAVITNGSIDHLGLCQGRLVTAEIKAPLVILLNGDVAPSSSAENLFYGIISKVSEGMINTEYVVQISETTELCAIVSSKSTLALGLHQGDPVWAVFNCFSVVLQVD